MFIPKKISAFLTVIPIAKAIGKRYLFRDVRQSKDQFEIP